jgi:hypothetical protein
MAKVPFSDLSDDIIQNTCEILCDECNRKALLYFSKTHKRAQRICQPYLKKFTRAIISFYEPGDHVHWLVHVCGSGYEKLSDEIRQYNQQIADIKSGSASPKSYGSKHERRDFDVTRHFFELHRVVEGTRPGEEEEAGSWYGTGDDAGLIYENELVDLARDYSGLIELIKKPYDDNEWFSLGFHLLPITRNITM